jgi:hypothetical protein
MPVTVTYDLADLQDPNDRTYIRSMFERFGFQRERKRGQEDFFHSRQEKPS